MRFFKLTKVNTKPLLKLKKKRQWQIICKFQRSIAKRFREDADVAAKMFLLEEAIALYHACLVIHGVITSPKADLGVITSSLKVAERDLKLESSPKRRSSRPIPDEDELKLTLEKFLVRGCRVRCDFLISGLIRLCAI